MDSAPPFVVSQEEFILFHKIDRELYRILVVNLYREPAESMQILALWLWLERVGFRNVVKKIVTLPNFLINEVADEAVICLSCINNGVGISCSSSSSSSSSEGSDIPLMQTLMDKEISLQFLHENRVGAVQGMAKMMQDVCIRAFTDIMQQVIVTRNSSERMLGETQRVVVTPSSSETQFWIGSIGPCNVGLGRVLTPGIGNEIPADDRTLFVTFSKGYPVDEWEVRESFSRGYGDCIEALYMQEVQPNEQALFARIVFRKASTIDSILRGASKVKFTINGKHVWARKFVPKRARNFLPTSSPFLPGESSGSGS